MSFSDIRAGIEKFDGVFRRFQPKHVADELIVINDYAHHPTEVQATIKGARQGWPDRRIVAVFQPHLYSRTRDLYKEFGLSFFDAEEMVITDIYQSREKTYEGVSDEKIAMTDRKYVIITDT